MTTSPAAPPPAAPAQGFRAHVAAAAAALVLLAWLSTGTLAPLAATHSQPIVSQECGYLQNLDHPLHYWSFLMVDGGPKEIWAANTMVRRTLYPLVAYPAMKALGFLQGGVLTNVVLHVAVLVAFASFMRARFGAGAAIAAAWLLATHPGVHYWIGLPYSYAAIVPATVLATMCVVSLAELESAAAVGALSLAIGILFVAYDLLPFFLPATLAVIALRTRSPARLAIACAALFVPSLVNQWILARLGVPFRTENTAVYFHIVKSWLAPPSIRDWLPVLLDAPRVLVDNYLRSGFVLLPVLFAATWLLARRGTAGRLSLPERAILASVLLVWAFNNLAPPYGGWQLRGDWLARLYQPVFAILVVYVARRVGSVDLAGWRRRAVHGAAVATVLGSAAVVLGPWSAPRYTAWMYAGFYRHDRPWVMLDNLERYGRRPLGFCDPAAAARAAPAPVAR